MKSIYVIFFFYFSTIFIQNIYKHDINVSINVALYSAILTSIFLTFLEYIRYKDEHIQYLDRLNYSLFSQNREVSIILSFLNNEELNKLVLKKSKDNNTEIYSKIIQE